MRRDELQQGPGTRRKMSSVLDMLNLRYQLNTQVEISNRQLDKQVWGSGERSRLKIIFCELTAKGSSQTTKVDELSQEE